MDQTSNSFRILDHLNYREVDTFIWRLEELKEEEIAMWWNHKFTAPQREILRILGPRIEFYPKCKRIFIPRVPSE
jgi:hypothetical protein